MTQSANFHMIRVPNEVWEPLKNMAKRERCSVTTVVLRQLDKLVGTTPIEEDDKKNKNVLNPKSPTSFPVGSMDASGEF